MYRHGNRKPAEIGTMEPIQQGGLVNFQKMREEKIRRMEEYRSSQQLTGLAESLTKKLREQKQQSRGTPSRTPRGPSAPTPSGPIRKSRRIQGTPVEFAAGLDYSTDSDNDTDIPLHARHLLAKARRAPKAPGTGRRGPTRGKVDSGKGVRYQGGRLYDSANGDTCHWCRQKTLEDKVRCTAANCGAGCRAVTVFCGMCLRNRHGEDLDAAIRSGCWVCPRCRGTCGPGCDSCCNCSFCRLAIGLPPTGNIRRQVLKSGFDNAHDWLIHLRTGESKEEIAARKLNFAWGRFLTAGRDGN